MKTRLAMLLPKGDRRLLLAYAGLCLYGLAMLWSVTESIRGPYESFDPGVPKSIFWRQMIWMGAAWFMLLVAARLPLRHLEELSPLFYGASIVMLIAVLAVAPVVMGARRWFPLGPFSLQPAEIAKVCLILLLARVMTRQSPERHSPAMVAQTGALVGLPFLLVLKEPDLGTALVFPAVWLAMITWYGVSWVFLLAVGSPVLSAVISFYSESVVHQAWPWGIYLLLLLGVLFLGRFRLGESAVLLVGNIVTGLGIPFIWGLLEPYQQNRVLTFFDPSRDTMGAGYQVFQSKVAIGAGGLFGTHYLRGTQKGLAFLPERQTDFIFSVVGEELGLLGAIVLLLLFLFLILRGLSVAAEARRPFASFVAIGATAYFCFHVVVNVSITSGLMPVTGVPLPLLSYGGSNLLTSAFLTGLLLNVGARDYDA